MGFDFSLVDVFTDRPFGGNRLAVFPDATGIADATMQQLAREFNFSEITFVLPPGDPSCTCRVRISEHEAGLAPGLSNTALQTGTALGVAIVTTVAVSAPSTTWQRTKARTRSPR